MLLLFDRRSNVLTADQKEKTYLAVSCHIERFDLDEKSVLKPQDKSS